MKVFFDVIRIACLALFSCFVSPKKLAGRSWSSEFTFRLAKRMLQESIVESPTWLRARQKALKLYSPALLSVTKQIESVSGVSCLTFIPKRRPETDTVIVYFHGGGYVVGSADGYSSTMAKLALACDATVVGVDYRLAPEHKIPAAQEDCAAVTERILKTYQNKKVILMGDSAGGALCLATLSALAKSDIDKTISACVLISPWLTPLDSGSLELANELSDILDKEVLTHWVDLFYRCGAEQKSYVDFSQPDLSALPPMYIQAAGAEVFIKQIDDYVLSLKKANVAHKYDVYKNQFHVFQTFAPLVREADEAISKIASFTKALD